MTTREVILDGGSPWGFRMHGGTDVHQPLRISRVNPGSKAALKGVREGDIITSINNQSTRDITNNDAHNLLKHSGDTLKLGLNEEWDGFSPKRRQFTKTTQQESHSESIERSSLSTTSYTTSTSITVNHGQSGSIKTENLLSTKTNGTSENCDHPEIGVASQRSTLSSNYSSDTSSANSKGIGSEIQRELHDSAPRNNESSEIIVTKPASVDNEKDVITDIEMGGTSRSHKRRLRASRKKSKNSNAVITGDASTCETMVEVPTPLNGDVTRSTSNLTTCVENESVEESSDIITESVEVRNIAESKISERVDTNYRVESPETVSKQQSSSSSKQNSGIVKSKSLDDDDVVKITELLETSEGEGPAECNAVVTEADSDVEWETTKDFKTEECREQHVESLNISVLPMETPEIIEIRHISPEDERNLRNFLEGLNLVTSPEESVTAVQKKETYKERKARKRAAIAQHFMPVLQHPRYLDAISEEGSDSNGDKETAHASTSRYYPEEMQIKKGSIGKRMESHFPQQESEKVVVIGGKLIEKANVQGSWSTTITETSSTAPEVVYLDDSSPSKTPSDSSDCEDENQEDFTTKVNPEKDEESETKILPPLSQLTPPPTPDLATPKNETICEKSFFETDLRDELKKEVTQELTESNISACKEDAFDMEFKGFCEELNLENPCKYVNAVSPARSPSISSEGSSKTNTISTVRYNPMTSSIGDVADLLKEEEQANSILDSFQPESLRALCLHELMSLPFGADVLEELAEVSESIQDFTGSWQAKITPSLQKLTKNYSLTIPALLSRQSNTDNTNDSFKLLAAEQKMPVTSTTNWVGIPTQGDPKILVWLSPTQKSYLETIKKSPNEAGELLELHEKFFNRRGYYETDFLSNDKQDLDHSPKPKEFNNRLLAIIKENTVYDNTSPNCNYYTYAVERQGLSNNLTVAGTCGNPTARDFRSTLNLSREKSTSAPQLEKSYEFPNTQVTPIASYQSNVLVNERKRVQCPVGNPARSTNIPFRRFSLPQELYQRQVEYIREKEREIQEEIEKLEEEKRKVISEMSAGMPVRQFEAGKYHISKKGDIAIHNEDETSLKIGPDQQRTAPMAPTEFFRQKMYDEYMRKVAAREDRKMHKVIKITSSKTSQVDESDENQKCEITHVTGIEDEFMDKVNERMRKYGLKRDDSEENQSAGLTPKENIEPVLVMDGDLLKDANELPKHLQEFVDITRNAADKSEGDSTDGELLTEV